ncbi:MAG: CrcB family protein [Pseudomonadales bacterium]
MGPGLASIALSAWLWVAAGSALGACARLAVTLVVGVGHNGWPWNTLVVNIAGSLAIGCAWGLWVDSDWFAQWGRYFIVVGLLGGFTTFSAFSLEMLWLLEAQRPAAALLLAVSSVLVCLLAVWAGHQLGQQWSAQQ